MRLTLRTLLAYLDNTLDAEDAESLRAKLTESGFATQLVQRIRATLVDGSLSAPSPNAVDPVSEANVISEYLDSTLSSEQATEIERACLGSPAHSAEAAACHQILTMVLGQPADVPDSLRQRIYDLPDRSIDEIPVSGSFSAVSVPEADTLTGMPDPTDSPDAVLQSPAERVEPVGAADSGVTDAPTRLRESEAAADSDEHELAMAGSTSRVKASDLYTGVRPSRITPWLVSLALAGVFLFAFIKIFAPLLSDPVANSDDPRVIPVYREDDVKEEIEVPAEQAPVMETVGTPAVDIIPTPEATTDDSAEELPLPSPLPSPAVASDTETMPASVASTDSVDPVPTDLLPMDPLTGEPMAVPTGDVAAVDAVMPDPLPADPLPADATTEVLPTASATADDPKMADPKVADVPPPAEDLAPPVPAGDVPLARVTGDKMLLMARAEQTDWVMVSKDSVVSQRPTLLNAPKFRSTLNLADKAIATLVDATMIQFMRPADTSQIAGVDLQFGRVLISTIEPNTSMQVSMANRTLTLTMPTADTIVAIEVRFLRRPGFDPFIPDNHIPIARVVSVQGSVEVSADSGDQSVDVGQQWLVRGNDPPKVSKVLVATWFDPKKPDDSPVDASAREGLLALVSQGQALGLSLREATGFRQSEVAALAAQTMLFAGNGDVYFGTDGILSQPKQRAFWQEHFKALRSMVNHDVESAKAVRDDIAKMDSADGKSLFRLLMGYSQNQLVEGGDEELIGLLESNVMAVRVLTVENLREITGTTLYFRAEEENAARRAQSIKKWKARQRKSGIRWTQE